MSRAPTPEELDLWSRAAAAREHAYAPYSRFPVGAALQLADGSVTVPEVLRPYVGGLAVLAPQG